MILTLKSAITNKYAGKNLLVFAEEIVEQGFDIPMGRLNDDFVINKIPLENTSGTGVFL